MQFILGWGNEGISMIGVILWRSIDDSKAVIWCEDQGNLAFADIAGDQIGAETGFDVGDVVQFDVSVERNIRCAKNVTRLLDNWGSSLADALTRLPVEPGETSDSTNVLPFSPGPGRARRQAQALSRVRHG